MELDFSIISKAYEKGTVEITKRKLKLLGEILGAYEQYKSQTRTRPFKHALYYGRHYMFNSDKKLLKDMKFIVEDGGVAGGDYVLLVSLPEW